MHKSTIEKLKPKNLPYLNSFLEEEDCGSPYIPATRLKNFKPGVPDDQKAWKSRFSTLNAREEEPLAIFEVEPGLKVQAEFSSQESSSSSQQTYSNRYNGKESVLVNLPSSKNEIIIGNVSCPVDISVESSKVKRGNSFKRKSTKIIVGKSSHASNLVQSAINTAIDALPNPIQNVNDPTNTELDPNMLLINIPFDKWGKLIGAEKAIYYLPSYLLYQIRGIHIYYGQLVVDAAKKPNFGKEALALLWKKFLLLPLLLHANVKRYVLVDRIKQLKAGQWHFKVKHIMREERSVRINRGQRNKESFKEKSITRAIRCRQISKAVQILNQETVTNNSNKDEVFTKLSSKYPHPNIDANYIANKEDIIKYRAPPDIKLKVTKQSINSTIAKCKNLTRPGIDQLKFEHLKALIGNHFGKQEPDEVEYSNILAHIIELIANADHPAEVGYAFRENELIAIPKGSNGDIRPIAMGSTYRKLASKLWFNKMTEFNSNYFQKYQYGLKKKGMELIIHSLTMKMQQYPEFDIYLVDASNAFNSIKRVQGLTEVKKRFPGVLPFLSSMYMENSHCWFQGKADGIASIVSDEGFHQGDVLSSWLYVLSLQPMLDEIDQNIRTSFGEEAVYGQYWYIDDGSIIGPRKVVCEVIRLIRDIGPNYGYHINMDKGTYLFGNCNGDTDLLKESMRYVYTQFHIPIEKLLYNPEYFPNIRKCNQRVEDYGAIVLGAPIGSDAYVQKQLQIFVEKELIPTTNNLINHPDVQERWTLFTRSYLFKPYHLYRTIPPPLMGNFYDQIEYEKNRILASLLACDVDCMTAIMNLASIPISAGGLGTGNAENISLAAFVASLYEISGLFNPDIKLFDINDDCKHIRYFNLCCSLLDKQVETVHDPHNPPDYNINSLHADIMDQGNQSESIQHILVERLTNRSIKQCHSTIQLEDQTKFRWMQSLMNPHSGKWLEAIPTNNHLVMDNKSFTAALRFRLFMPYRGYRSNLLCNCNKEPKIVLDPHGDHLATGCNKYNTRVQLHDAVCRTIRGLLKYVGYHTTAEQRNVLGNGDQALRPDITVHDYKGRKDLCLDISITSTLRYHSNGAIINDCLQGSIGKYGVDAYNSKLRKYQEAAANNNRDFLPFIIESSGMLHKEAEKFIRNVATTHEKNLVCRNETILNFMYKSISITFQRAMTSGMLKRYEALCQLQDTGVKQFYEAEVYASAGRLD